MKKYILVDKDPVEVESMTVWGMYMEDNKHVDSTSLGDFWISTVFLGIDHNWRGKEPILFETMVFNNEYDDHDFEYYQTRCATYTEAEQMHKKGVLIVEKYELVKRADAIVKCGVLALITVLLIYLTL